MPLVPAPQLVPQPAVLQCKYLVLRLSEVVLEGMPEPLVPARDLTHEVAIIDEAVQLVHAFVDVEAPSLQILVYENPALGRDRDAGEVGYVGRKANRGEVLQAARGDPSHGALEEQFASLALVLNPADGRAFQLGDERQHGHDVRPVCANRVEVTTTNAAPNPSPGDELLKGLLPGRFATFGTHDEAKKFGCKFDSKPCCR